MPVPIWSGQKKDLPRWHHSHLPHVDCSQGTPTPSPTFRVVTPSPKAIISPAGS
jgi:hypothetical protein